jgi:Arc/MetJ-type ribon-helix-helix transcriptional regulator
MTSQVAVRLPVEQLKAIDELVGRGHGSRSEVIRRALELYLYRLACERDAQRYAELPLSEVELSLADDDRGWSATPAW